ncbi:hypothetical protein ACFY71_10625 [Streptomyces cinerochromogenes]|uniref:hypothetical protein n=1 Tax=Streptomyces cinerochromogenes TaxID=66422 RepID=UPI0036A6FA34
MSLQPRPGAEIPALTVRVARAGNPHGTTAMWIRDRCRIGFTCALGLEVEDPGFHHSVLSDFRDGSPRATAPTGCWAWH